MKRKTILTILAVILLIIIGGVGLMFYFMGQPMYQPGKLSEATITVPEQDTAGNFWKMGEGIQLYHFANGNGDPILLLHGGPGMPYKDTLPGFNKLADHYTIHYYDQRGAGRSTKPFDRFESGNFYENLVELEFTLGIAAQLKDVERIRQILGEEKLTIIGHSFGGYLASLYAAEFPDHVKKLVLISPAEVLKFPPESGGLYEIVKSKLPEEKEAEYETYMEKFFDFGHLFEKSEKELADLQAEFGKFFEMVYKEENGELPSVNANENAGWGVYAQFFSMGKKSDFREFVRGVKAPTLVIHGANDLQSAAGSKVYVETIPNARFEVLDNAGHFAFVEQSEEFAALVMGFLKN